VRLLVDDKPGVLGYVATAFGNAGVSLESVIQTQRNVVDHAEIVAITHRVEHAQMQAALSALAALDVVDEIRSVIRVEQERG
jgi:homoserine dehydrogenase